MKSGGVGPGIIGLGLELVDGAGLSMRVVAVRVVYSTACSGDDGGVGGEGEGAAARIAARG